MVLSFLYPHAEWLFNRIGEDIGQFTLSLPDIADAGGFTVHGLVANL
jgi:hypothetical protein